MRRVCFDASPEVKDGFKGSVLRTYPSHLHLLTYARCDCFGSVHIGFCRGLISEPVFDHAPEKETRSKTCVDTNHIVKVGERVRISARSEIHKSAGLIRWKIVGVKADDFSKISQRGCNILFVLSR